MQSQRRKVTLGGPADVLGGRADAFRGLGRIAFYAAAVALAALWGCSSRPAIRMQALEGAPLAEMIRKRHVLVGDLELLGEIYRPLCPRLGIIQVTTEQDWNRLGRAIPDLGPCPDLRRGAVVGIVSRAGTPLDGRWPIEITEARVIGGAGYIAAEFRPGTYLADDLGYATLSQCGNVAVVLMVDVNGIRYFTD